jgi:hypothetical protein
MDPDRPDIQALLAERDQLKRELRGLLSNVGFPPGHFYSPVVNVADQHAIKAVRDRISSPFPAGVRIDSERMALRLKQWSAHPTVFPFPRHQIPEYRFYFDNPYFGCHDAGALFSIIMEFRPRRVIEIGCGFSSSLLLDTNERFFSGKIELTLIDPNLDDLRARFDALRCPHATLIVKKLQDVPNEVFEPLERNDILFIDSSHVSKTGSDVNHYLFEILPALKTGVLIHIHDILYPFEYLEDWILKEKRSWNEAYLVRAFLLFNPAFDIVYWANFASHRLRPVLAESMPLFLENEGGSLWLQRTG